jgi:hypothetical protein
MPRCTPAGSGLPQPAFSAASFEHLPVARLLASSARRNSNGSLPAACAISSMKLSMKKLFCEWPTERQNQTWAGLAPAVGDELVGHAVRVVG